MDMCIVHTKSIHCSSYLFVSQKYLDLKHEIINNKIYTLSPLQIKISIKKTNKLMNTFKCKSVRCHVPNDHLTHSLLYCIQIGRNYNHNSPKHGAKQGDIRLWNKLKIEIVNSIIGVRILENVYNIMGVRVAIIINIGMMIH